MDVFACSQVWKDLKELRKRDNRQFSPIEEIDGISSDEQKLQSFPGPRAMLFLLQDRENKTKKGILCDKQPILDKGWKVYKLRWAISNRGASDGIRVIYARKDDGTLLFIYFYSKKPSRKETEHEAEIHTRLAMFLG